MRAGDRPTPLGPQVVAHAQAVMQTAKRTGLSIVTAESCTTGLVATALSLVPGAGEFLHGGFLTYTKEQKTAALGVPADLLVRKTAVCIEVARLMAQGALRHSPAHVSVAVTGVAGPEPDEDGNPVGYLCLASARNGTEPIELECHLGAIGRDQIIEIAVERALSLLERVMRTSQ